MKRHANKLNKARLIRPILGRGLRQRRHHDAVPAQILQVRERHRNQHFRKAARPLPRKRIWSEAGQGIPQDNGAHERLHRDISREIEALGQSDQGSFDLWRQIFNYERPHETLGMRCPGELYRSSERKYEGTPDELHYPQMCARRVGAKGAIKVDNQHFFLSTALAGWDVGLKPLAQDRLEVWFGRLLLGQVDLSVGQFVRADIGPNKPTDIPKTPT
jgi:hypothetical protein